MQFYLTNVKGMSGSDLNVVYGFIAFCLIRSGPQITSPAGELVSSWLFCYAPPLIYIVIWENTGRIHYAYIRQKKDSTIRSKTKVIGAA